MTNFPSQYADMSEEKKGGNSNKLKQGPEMQTRVLVSSWQMIQNTEDRQAFGRADQP